MGVAETRAGDKPAIAVLPFESLDEEPDYPRLGDAIAEEVITTLSRIPQLRVIARGSSFQYRTEVPDVRVVADELGVRYVLQGSVRSAETRVRVSAHLGDVATGDEIWSERYDRDLDDIFELQDEISSEIATTLEAKLGFGEQVRGWRRGLRSLAAYEHFANFHEEYLKFSRQANRRARREAQAALELDPQFVSAHVAVASSYGTEAHLGWGVDRKDSLELAREALQRALDIEPESPEANALLGRIQMLEGDYDAAIATTGKALEAWPSYAWGYHLQAMNLLYTGRFAEAAEADRQVFLLSPLAESQSDNSHLYLATAYYHLGRLDEASDELDVVLARRPNWLNARALRVATLLRLGDEDSARREAKRILSIKPRFSTSWWASLNPYRNTKDLEAILGPLHEAGLPEEPGERARLFEPTKPETPPERVLATVLFTDIVSSTEMAVELGDRQWRQKLDEHDEVARECVNRHRGRFIKSTGDGIHAVFDRPGDAISCALDLIVRLQELGLGLRAGAHTGEVEIRGNDVDGIAVHVAARVAAEAGPDQILVSRTVKDLVAGSEFELISVGASELKGVPDPQELFSVRI
ncbi:MAG: tetratricopeptide repeat protein [Acidimicrobiia bacterium]